MGIAEIVALAGGLVITGCTLSSAVRTVVGPRAQSVATTRILFMGMRLVFDALAATRRSYAKQDAVLVRYAPTTLMLLPLLWAVGVTFGFSLIYWAFDVRPYRDAFVLSGSSLTTMGFRTTDDIPTLMLAIIQGLIGLGLAALLISFLPTIYGLFGRREAAVARLEVRAGSPPTPYGMLVRAHQIGWLDDLDEMWATWEEWFVEVEESHVSYPALVFFRSSVANRSWVNAAGGMLDTAALMLSSVDVRPQPRAALMIRAGYIALRRIAGLFGIRSDPDPRQGDPISVSREEFDDLLDRLADVGVPLKPDRGQAWLDFAGWRVNYDDVLQEMRQLASAPPAPWSGNHETT